MAVTKRLSARVVLSLLVLILAGAFFLAAQSELPPQSPLETLLSGASTDLAGTLSTMPDADLPLALAVTEALKFKALHGDSGFSVREIEDFHQALSKRLEAGQKVSMTKSSACSVPIPLRKVTLAGLELTVPAHFVAEQPLVITEVSPQGEAGTLFPEIRVSFLTDKPPVKATLTLDGRVLTPVKHNPGFVAFRPGLSLENLVPIGTHTASVVLTDAANRQISRSWSFTVGSRPVLTPDVPETAEVVATLTMGLSQVVAGAPPGFSLTVVVRETPDGQRFFEYVIGDGTPTGSSFMRTSSLVWVHRLGKCRGGEEFLILLPKTSMVFPGNLVKFVGSYQGPGQVLEMNWTIVGWGIPTTIVDGPTATARPQAGVSGVFKVKVSDTWPDGTPNTMMLSKQKGVGSFEITCQNDQRSKVFTETGTGTLKLAGRRTCYLSEAPSELVEGTTLPVEGGGTLIVITSRWKIVAGTASATIENIQATSTRLLFTAPGFIEVVHDLALSYTCEDEEYSWQYDPLNSIRPYPGSGLFGCFLVKGNVVTEKWPPGIIQGTARKVALRQFSVQINEEKRTFTAPDQMILSPPWVLARSTLFPASYPLELTQIMPVLTARFGPPSSPMTYAYFRDSFETTLTYPADKPFVSEVPCQFGVYPSSWKGLGVFPPIGDILGLPAYRSPADLVEIAIDPLEPIVYEGQKCEFTGRIVPKDGLGEGEITEQADSLDLLDGYLSQGLDSVEWNATLLPQETPLKHGSSLRFDFEPQQGTGTYAVVASTVVSLKEKDTDSVAKAAGISSTTVVVKPGFKILTPFDRFAYPVGMPIKVTTNRDDDDAVWQSIVWSVNGKPWKPEEQAAPAFLTPDKEGDWTIAGTLTIQDENGQDIALRDQVKFSVKSVSTQMDPTRKVVSPPPKTVPLTLGVKLGDVPISKLDQVVDWASGSMKAKVESITWKAFSSPTTEKALTVNNPPLTAAADFDKEGPITILATVTVRFWSTNPQKPYDQTFPFPAARADLWAVAAPAWQALDGHLPKQAIAETKRSFTVKSGSFLFKGDSSHAWSLENGIDPMVQLTPAIPGVSPIEGKDVNFSWEGPDGQTGDGPHFIAKFSIVGVAELNLVSALDFGPAGSVSFLPYGLRLGVSPLSDHVKAGVEPQSFVLIIDGTQKLEFLLYPKDSTSGAQEIKVMAGEYALKVLDAAWFQQDETLGSGNPFTYHAIAPTNDEIKAEGTVEIVEADTDSPPPPDQTSLFAFASIDVVAPRIDLQVTDLFGTVSEDVEHTTGAFIHFNIDNDNRNTTDPDNPDMGPPIPDHSEQDFVQWENDLVPAKISLWPLAIGNVRILRDNEHLRVWCSPTKEASSAILVQNGERKWDLANEGERKEFEQIKESLWVEGCGGDSSGLTVQYSYHGDRYDFSDYVKFVFLSANCGRQPTPNEERTLHDAFPYGMGLPLIGCEYSITGEHDKKYNCVAWSVDEDNVIYKGTVATPSLGVVDIDLAFGNQDGLFDFENDLDPFYRKKGFELIVESENQNPEMADVIYFEGDHAAKKKKCSDGKGKWFMFESKLGTNVRIEHVWDQVICGSYGKPCRYYRCNRSTLK